MDLDERAEKLKSVKWRTDRTAFTADCPLSNGTVHRIAVSSLKTKCLGGCADDAVGKFFLNGSAVSSTSIEEPKRAPATKPRQLPAPQQSRIDDILRRVPPQNLEAEQSVLGAVLLDNDAIEEANRILKPEDFYRESHREIFKAMRTLWRDKVPIDAVTLSTELKGKLEHIGGPAYLAELAVVVPTAQNVAHYSNIVKSKAITRQIATHATQLASAAYEGVSASALIGETERLLAPFQALELTPSDLPQLTKSSVEIFDWGQMRVRRAEHIRDWAVEGMLARRETSSWSGKVEAGKTTLMRELTMAVIRGEPFLGRQTVKGRVFYAMLDADGEDVTYDEFAKLGFTDADAAWCKFMFEPNMAQIENGLEQFVKVLKDFEPTLVIIDPYPRLKAIEDFHSYTNTYLMGMLSEIAKTINAHLALPGHIPRGRSDDDDVATAGFGSISFSGGVNARFVVTNRNGIHTVRSSKGKAAGFVPFDAEYVLSLDADTSRVVLGEPFSWKDKGRAAADPVAAFLAANNDRPFDLASLAREIHLQKSVVRTALGNLFNEGRIRREGEGLKRSPFIYASKTYDGVLTLAEVKRE